MAKTTPPPRVNILEALPELAHQTVTTIRLHPRRGEFLDPAASKIGGLFLWPEDEPWPTMPSKRPEWWSGIRGEWELLDGTPIPLVPVLQINARDVPDFPFPPGQDLMQLLWYPLDGDEPPYFCIPRVFWRNSTTITKSLTIMPLSPYADTIYVPHPCTLTFERVIEYPHIEDLSEEQFNRFKGWFETKNIECDEYAEDECASSMYQFELSVCPGSKLGGYVAWIQRIEWQTCGSCGQQMEHLLSLTDIELDGGTLAAVRGLRIMGTGSLWRITKRS
ncbi:MAG TPA: DUF1963 domain-containing protein [Phototrophicaceae bacterium]|nr:DUF1963 domain-containing protein [Phototrophicaceae bacterium]